MPGRKCPVSEEGGVSNHEEPRGGKANPGSPRAKANSYPQTLPMAFREPTNQSSPSAGREDAQGCEQDFKLTVPLWHSCCGNSILFHS